MWKITNYLQLIEHLFVKDFSFFFFIENMNHKKFIIILNNICIEIYNIIYIFIFFTFSWKKFIFLCWIFNYWFCLAQVRHFRRKRHFHFKMTQVKMPWIISEQVELDKLITICFRWAFKNWKISVIMDWNYNN